MIVDISDIKLFGIDIIKSYRKFEDTKGVVKSCKWKKDRKYNGKKKKDKRINSDLQKTTQKTQH